MKLKIRKVKSYIGDKPVLGEVVAQFKGNQKQCTAAAKKWASENPSKAVHTAYEWEPS